MFDEYSFVEKRQQEAEINMGPLLDMVFILLIFFVVTAQFSEESSIEVQRPGAESALRTKGDPLLISITPEGNFHIHGSLVSGSELETILQQEAAVRTEPTALIIGDRGSSLHYAVTVMDICNRVGITEVSIATDKI